MIAAMLLVTTLGHGAPGTTKQLATGQSEGGDLVLRCGLLINGLLDEPSPINSSPFRLDASPLSKVSTMCAGKLPTVQ